MNNQIKKWILNNVFTKEGKLKSISQKHRLYNDNIETFNLVNKMVKIDVSISQKCKLFLQDIYSYPKCYCGNKITKYNKTKTDIVFYKYCCNLCSCKNAEKIQKMVNTRRYNNSFVTGGIKGYCTKLNDIDENGINGAIRNGQKALQTKIMKGCVVPLEKQDDWLQYRKKVYKLSDDIFYTHYYEINPNNFTRGIEYHLDHIYSVKEGFTNSIPIHIIASKHNLRVIPAHDNISKSSKCDISLETLIDLVFYE